MYSVAVAYFLWFIGGLGALGFHRFYMRKIPTGILYLLTGGLGYVGAIYDFITLPQQIREANLRERYRDALDFEAYRRTVDFGRRRRESDYGENENTRTTGKMSSSIRRDTPEKVILRVAKKNNGVASPGEVALEGDITVEEAKKYLEKLAAKGFAEMRIKKTGVIVYVFPEFVIEPDSSEFEDI